MREVLGSAVRRGRLVALAGLLALVAAGCGGKYTPVAVRGVVTLDGEPVEGATVYFYAIGDEREGRPAQGTTDRKGEYRLSTLGNEDGALRGEYKVVIHKYVPSQPKLKMPDFPDTLEGRNEKADWIYRNYEAKGIQPFKNALPEKYADSGRTPLTCKVTGRKTADFELFSK